MQLSTKSQHRLTPALHKKSMDLAFSHQAEIVLAYILTIVLLLFLLTWLYELCLWIRRLYLRILQQGNSEMMANVDPEVGEVDIHELFLKVWEDLGLWVPPQTPRHRREQAIEKFPAPEKYNGGNKSTGTTGCAICLEEYVSGDLFRVLPLCKHVYHSDCINRWLLDELRCPICRSSV